MYQASDFILFIGRFHPLVVHLPIGILLFAALLEIAARITKNDNYRSLIPFTLLVGTISAVVACILGYMLSTSGDYGGQWLDLHMWFGIGTTLISFLAYLLSIGKFFPSGIKGKPYFAALLAVTILLSATGHFGGNLTHGEEYLFAYAPFNYENNDEFIEITDVNEAILYDHLIEPILVDKCISCHRSGKKKGKLSMESYSELMKGGESGSIIFSGDSKNSELIHRVSLPKDHEDFMPPEGKTPLTKEEIVLIKFWINKSNADAQVTVGSIKAPDSIKKIAQVKLGLDEASKNAAGLAKVNPVSSSDLQKLQEAGYQVRELIAGSGLYDVSLSGGNMRNKDALRETLILLDPLRENILRLSLKNNGITDEHLSLLGNFSNLEHLQLQQNQISDKGIIYLQSLSNLVSLNLYNTNISRVSLDALTDLEKLKRVYVWGTDISEKEIKSFTENHQNLEVISAY